jgi:hypothetical protein
MGSSLDPTLAGIARYELLEDRTPTRTTQAAILNAAAPKHDLIQARAEALHAACLSDDYLCHGDPAEEHGHDISSLRPAAIFSLDTDTHAMASLPTSARDAKTKPDYEGPHGWRAAIQKEVTRVHNFGAITLVPAKDARAVRAAYGDDQVTIGHIVLAFRNKTDPSGNPLDDDISRKARITIADKRGKSTEHNFYSACVGSSTDRIVTQIAVEKRAIQHTKDVGGAYYHGDPPTPENGGRLVYAFVPPWLADFGDYPTHAADGTRNLLYIPGNMPGRRDAGRIWEVKYDHFLLDYGLTQCVFDTRVFRKVTADGFLIVHIHVDDTRITAQTLPIMQHFVNAWCAAFNEDPDDCSVLSEDFAGVRHQRIDLDTCSLSSDGAIESLKSLLEEFPPEPFMSTDFPLASDALPKLRAGSTDSNPLLLHLLTPARRFMGVVCFVVNNRPDAHFASKVLARYTNETRLTKYAWGEIRRIAAYLVATRNLHLTLHRTEGQLVAHVDSSLANAEGGHSWGGYSIAFTSDRVRSGSIIFSSSTPNCVTEATGVAELHQADRVTKAIAGMRIFLRELGHAPSAATKVYTDARVLIDGTNCRKVTNEAKWVSTRLAMVRWAQSVNAIILVKTTGKANSSDIYTKPLTGALFCTHRTTELGLLPNSLALGRQDAVKTWTTTHDRPAQGHAKADSVYT